MMLIDRTIEKYRLKTLMDLFPVTAILGARQCGKTTLARQFQADVFFDLENPRDLARFDTPQLTLEQQQGLIVIDEIQRVPELFPLLRYMVDVNPDQQYLILGSASRDLIRQSSESLAGRIGYYGLAGLQPIDVKDLQRLWLRGGYPRAYLAKSDQAAFVWLEQYITTFMERDIPQLGINIPAVSLRRFWTMLSHYHGQLLNYSELSRSFGVSDMTVRKYVEILEGTFMVRVLSPWHINTSKRLVKAPKLYFRDSGIFHSFSGVDSMNNLTSHSKLGASWEGFALESACRAIGKQDDQYYFWRTHTGAELDLFWQHKGKNWGVEIKYSDAPRRTKSMSTVFADLKLEHLWILYPGQESYSLDERISVRSLNDLKGEWDYST